MGGGSAVGRRVRRKDGPDKLRGLAKYIDDYAFPGCLYGTTLRSSIARGRILGLRFDPDFPWGEYVVVTAKDIPGANHVALIENDQPLLADGKVLHPQEPIALVAHPVREKAYAALRRIRVDYRELDPVLTLEESLRLKRKIYSKDNTFKRLLIAKGDIESGFRQARVVVEGEYRVPHQEQAYIENNGMAAYVEEGGGIVVLGSMQCPFYVRKALEDIFSLPGDQIRVVQTATGGGFGGKEDYPSLLAGHAALLAWKSRKPVKLIYDRPEDMAATTKRHPALIRHRTGLDPDGKLLAQDIEVVMDGGAYMTLSPVVLSRGAIHASGPYACPNVRIRARSVATNTPPNGAFRGFGAPQTLFAAELHMDRCAQALRLDPVDIRRRNLLREGSSTATGQVLRQSVGAEEVLESCARRSGWKRKRGRYAAHNLRAELPTWRGIGLALVHHGGGFTGGGEVALAGKAGICVTRRGDIRVLAASTELGQGTNTMFAQIAADALGVSYDWISVATPDTSRVPDSGPTVASRTCMVVGKLLERACAQLRAELDRVGPKRWRNDASALRSGARKLCGAKPAREFIVSYERPKEILWNEESCRGDAYGSFSYAAVAVDLEVDKRTCEVRLRGITAAFEIGKAIHPALAEGQVLGGIAQGIGYALYEYPVFKNGSMANARLADYILPTSMDLPAVNVRILEKPYSHGPFGAKGLGELPMDAPAPAVAAAVHHATGAWLCELPMFPERIREAIP